MKTGDKLGFGLGQVKWYAVSFGKSRDQKNKEADDLRNDKPFERRIYLRVDDSAEVERSRKHHNTDY